MSREHPEAASWAARNGLRARYDAQHPGLVTIRRSLERVLKDLLRAHRVRGTVKSRVKSFDVFYGKVLERARTTEITAPFVEVTDLVGLRVVTPFIEDIAHVADLIRGRLDVTEEEDKGQALSVAEFGYDSTHLLVAVPSSILKKAGPVEIRVAEIQLRTTLQDAWAEVEHELIYKANLGPEDRIDKQMRRKLVALNATLSLADTIFQELRDYQQHRYAQLHARHRKLMDRVSTIPEKPRRPMPLPEELKSFDALPPPPLSESALNDVVVRALQAHLDADLEEAIRLYSQVLAIQPAAAIYTHRGAAWLALGEYVKAVADFTSALELAPQNISALTSRGLAKRMLGQPGEALMDLDESFALNPTWPDTLYGRALAHFDEGNVPAALEDCDRAIALKPQFRAVIRFKRFIQDSEL